MSEIDWSALQKEAASAGVLPDGSYDVIITEATSSPSSTGKPMIKVKFRVTAGPHKDKPIWNQFVVSPESPIALRIFFSHMAALGLDSSFFASQPSMDVVAKNLVNRAATIELGTRQWQGQDRNEVKSISTSAAGGPVAPGVVTGPPVPGASPMTPPAPMATPAPMTPPVPTTPGTPPTPPPTPAF